MPLTPETIAVVQATAPVVAEHVLDITTTFYKTMFTNNPEVLAFFNKSHQKGGSQPRALADAVVAYATQIEHLDRLGPLVARMAHRHCALSVKPEFYEIVHKNLMIAIGKVLGDAVTPEIGEAWSNAVLALAEICIGAEATLYEANEKRQGGWKYERDFVLAAKKQIAEDTCEFEFKAADGYDGGFEFTAGQYLTVRCDGLSEAPRHYTLTSKSGEPTLKISTRRVPGGAMSSYMHDTMQVGDTVKLGAPSGIFVADETKNAVLVSAGIGITPMVAFQQALPADKIKACFHMDTTAERDALSQKLKGTESTKVLYTKGGARPDLAEEAKALKKFGGKGCKFYVCGPVGFMVEMSAKFQQAGVPESDIVMEVFGTGTTKTVAAAAKASAEKTQSSAAASSPVAGKLGNTEISWAVTAAVVVAFAATTIVPLMFRRTGEQ